MTAPAKPGSAVAVKARDVILAEVAEKYSAQIAALAPEGMAPEHFIASLRLYMAQNPAVVECTPASVAMGVLRAAQTGLTLGVSCDLLPFGKVCQFSPRYGGIIELALAAGANAINADVVREGDFFEYEKGTKPYLKHHRNFQGGAKITHAYAVAALRFGQCVFEVATREEIDALRLKYSKSWKHGSLDEIPWYAKKTMVRKLGPYLPKNPRLAAALMFADAKEPEDGAVDAPPPETMSEHMDPETGEVVAEVESL